ncbi:hypothetical protein HN588_05020 [Candidatus Bathyarchaeota archaeon]|nr:hypothetical protein [Candidatus Bathyarchaeota archaeon]
MTDNGVEANDKAVRPSSVLFTDIFIMQYQYVRNYLGIKNIMIDSQEEAITTCPAHNQACTFFL